MLEKLFYSGLLSKSILDDIPTTLKYIIVTRTIKMILA